MTVLKGVAIFAASAMLSGCATMDTSHVLSGDRGGEGISYFLPTGHFDLKMYERDGDVWVTIGAPRLLPDGSMPVRTALRAGGTADNDFTVVVGDDGLLSSVKGSSEGKVTEIATELAKVIALNSAERPSDLTPFFERPYRFSDFAQAERDANAALGQYMAVSAQADCRPTKGKPPGSRCLRIREISSFQSRGRFIHIVSDSTAEMVSQANLTTVPALPPKAPRDALFYHPLAPIQLTLHLANGYTRTDVFAVPDKSRVDWVRAPSGMFAKQEYDFAFTHGVLTSYKRVARNESVGLVSLPIKVVKAVISAPIELLGARTSVDAANTAYLTQLNQLAGQATTAKNSCKALPAICGNSVYRIIGATTATKPPQDDSSAPGNGTPRNDDVIP